MALGIRFCTTRCVKDFESGIVEASRVLQLQRAQHGPEYTVDIAIKTHYITYCLDRMGYFRGAEPQSKTKLRESLSNFLRVVDENSHEIVHFNGVPPKTVGRFSSLEPSDYVEHLGACVNLNNTLFNNSCDVNTYKYHVGNRTVMVAKKSIKVG